MIESVAEMLRSGNNQLEKGESAVRLFGLEMKLTLLKYEEALLMKRLRVLVETMKMD